MHLLEAMRVAVSVLLASALALSIVVLTRWSSPPPTVVVVPISAPIVEHSVVATPGLCFGYDARSSSIDLRWYCGYRD